VLFPLSLALAMGATGPFVGLTSDALLGADGGVCLATGYCTAPEAGGGAAPPGGLMYLALGLVGTGIAVLRTERRSRTPEP
jgi:hypothetical protein